MAKKKGRRYSKHLNLRNVIRILHLYPAFGPAVLGDAENGLAGAWVTFRDTQDFRKTLTEFYNVMVIEYTGFNPTTGGFHGRGYPFRTYLAHGAIELSAYLVNKFAGRAIRSLQRMIKF